MPDQAELEQRLAAVAREIRWPSTPNLAGRIGARITEPIPLRRPWFQTRWALAAAIAILALAALLAYTPTREVIAGWLNLHTIFTRVNELPSPSPRPSGSVGDRLALGQRTTLDGAQKAVGWKVVVPSSLGQPDQVYLMLPPSGPPEGEVTLVYLNVPGVKTSGETGVAVLVTEAHGKVDSRYFMKMLSNDTTVEEVTVGGHGGYWIAGSPHILIFIDAAGNLRNETMRLATNTLLIDEGGTVVRIEGNLTKAQALEIAASLG